MIPPGLMSSRANQSQFKSIKIRPFLHKADQCVAVPLVGLPVRLAASASPEKAKSLVIASVESLQGYSFTIGTLPLKSAIQKSWRGSKSEAMTPVGKLLIATTRRERMANTEVSHDELAD
jgi:hypothetical protein